MDTINNFFMAVLIFLIVYLIFVNTHRVINIKHIDRHYEESRPYFDIDILPLDKKEHHHQKYIPGVPTPKHYLPGVPTPKHYLPGVPTPTKKVNLTPHDLTI